MTLRRVGGGMDGSVTLYDNLPLNLSSRKKYYVKTAAYKQDDVVVNMGTNYNYWASTRTRRIVQCPDKPPNALWRNVFTNFVEMSEGITTSSFSGSSGKGQIFEITNDGYPLDLGYRNTGSFSSKYDPTGFRLNFGAQWNGSDNSGLSIGMCYDDGGSPTGFAATLKSGSFQLSEFNASASPSSLGSTSQQLFPTSGTFDHGYLEFHSDGKVAIGHEVEEKVSATGKSWSDSHIFLQALGDGKFSYAMWEPLLENIPFIPNHKSLNDIHFSPPA